MEIAASNLTILHVNISDATSTADCPNTKNNFTVFLCQILLFLTNYDKEREIKYNMTFTT